MLGIRCLVTRYATRSVPAAPRRRVAQQGGRRPKCRGMLAGPLLDDLIRPLQHRLRDRQAEGLGRPVVDHQLERCWLLDRKVTWLRALQDLVHVSGGPPPQIREVCTVRHEAPSLDVYPSRIYRGQPAPGHRVDESSTVRHEELGIGVQHTLATALSSERGRKIVRAAYGHSFEVHT